MNIKTKYNKVNAQSSFVFSKNKSSFIINQSNIKPIAPTRKTLPPREFSEKKASYYSIKFFNAQNKFFTKKKTSNKLLLTNKPYQKKEKSALGLGYDETSTNFLTKNKININSKNESEIKNNNEKLNYKKIISNHITNPYKNEEKIPRLLIEDKNETSESNFINVKLGEDNYIDDIENSSKLDFLSKNFENKKKNKDKEKNAPNDDSFIIFDFDNENNVNFVLNHFNFLSPNRSQIEIRKSIDPSIINKNIFIDTLEFPCKEEAGINKIKEFKPKLNINIFK